MQGFLLIPISLFAFSTIFTKGFQNHAGAGNFQAAFFNFINSGFPLFIFLVLNKFTVNITFHTLICAVIAGCILMVYRIVMIKAVSSGPTAIATMSYVLGGSLVPFLYGVIFLKESLNVAKIIGLVFIFASFLPIMLNQKRPGAISFKFFFFCAALFLMNGVFLNLSKIVQQNTPKQYATDYIILYTFFYFIFSIINLLYHAKSSDKNIRLSLVNFHSFLFPVLSSATNASGNVINLLLSYNIAASVQFPVLNLGIMVLVTILAFSIYKEKPKRSTILSIILAVFSIVFIAL